MRTKRIYVIFAIASEESRLEGVPAFDIIDNIGADELPARLANKPEGVEYRVFLGPEIRYQLRQVVEFDKPRRRPIRNVDPVLTDKPKRGRKASTNGVEKTDARLNREVVVTEKIDGTNGVVYVSDDGAVIAGSAVES